MNAKTFRIFAVASAFLLLAMALTPLADAQKKLQVSPGGYHGELDFPISWKRYYSHAEFSQIMKDLQQKYPHLADVESIGKSRMGRDQYLLTITAKDTGDHSTKTAIWVDGAVHGNEVNGISCSLYLAWYLLTRYDYDPYVFNLVNNSTFYILPGLNVDANESFVSHPNTASNPREPFRPEDNDGDGLYDEDRTEDVDGDGELSTMYIEDPTGDLKLSADKRRFISVGDPDEKVLRFRRIGAEGFDNDGDGRINEDDIGGPDPNRNYPSGWNLGAGNPFPMSEPCTRNAYEFMRQHPNIFAGFHYHNIGRLIYFRLPWGATERTADAQPATGQRGGQRGQRGQGGGAQTLEQLRETNKYVYQIDMDVSAEYMEDKAAQERVLTSGARILKNYRPAPVGRNGQAPASTYDFLGAYGYLLELWGSPAFDADMNDDGRVDDEEYLKWIDFELTGEGWIDPHKCEHPDLGEIWIGGSRKKHMSRTPPGRYIEMEALKNAQFVMHCASQFPKVEIDEITVKPHIGDLLWVDVAVKNDREYPTASDRSVYLNRAVKDKLTFTFSENVSIVEIPEKATIIDPLDNRTRSEVTTKTEHEFRLNGKQTLKYRYLIKMEGDKGWVDFKLESQRGGTAQKRLEITVSN